MMKTRFVFRLLAAIVTFVLVFNSGQSVHAGSGTYGEGTPDKLTLNVCFDFDVSSNFNPNTPWEGTLSRASELLYNATDGQLQIGTVNFYDNCVDVADRADIVVHPGTGGASANVDGLGTNGARVNLYNDTHTQNVSSARGHFGAVHELGHYIFGLYDEYLDTNGQPGASCTSASSTVASIMDGGTTIEPNNQRTEFALAADEPNCNGTMQFAKRNMVDWPWIVQHISDKHGATLTAPTAYDTNMPAGHQAVTFKYFQSKLRVAIALDRSGSMSGVKLSTAKAGAKLLVDLMKATDELGVSSYADSPTSNYALNTMTDANKSAARSAIDALVASGSTNIGGGLQTALNMITAKGNPVANEVIVLLSDGLHNVGTNPMSVLPAIQARGVVVYTIGLGSDADAALMSNIANATGGNYFFAADTSGLTAHFNSIFAELKKNGTMAELSENIAFGATNTHTLNVDTYTQHGGEMTFVLSWTTGSLDLALERWDGSPVNDSDPDVTQHVVSANSELYRISNPGAGTWKMKVVSPSTTTSYRLQANAAAESNALAITSSEKGVYNPNEPILLQTSVLAPPSGGTVAGAVAGAVVTGEVRVNGLKIASLALYDDGDASHGDTQASDGIYSNFYSPPVRGNYSFVVTALNQNGTTATGLFEEGPVAPPQPVDPFTRISQVTVFVLPPTPIDSTGVFRPVNGLLYLKNTNVTGFADMALNYGSPGDYPVVGDWDGNGTVTIGIYRNGYFYLRNENTIGFATNVFAFGLPGDQPIAGDWDGDGVDTIGIYRPTIGYFMLRNANSAGGANTTFYLGNPGDVGLAGDWDGDGIDTTGVFRPSNGIIFLKNANTTGIANIALNYGLPGDKPVTGDWNGDGIDSIGVYRNGTFYLRNENTIGFAEMVFGLGNPGDIPLAGNWDASVP